MAIRHSIAPVRSGGAFRSPAAHYARPRPVIEPDEPAPGTIDAWEATSPVRPDTAHVRAPRFLDVAGELIAALSLIAGGVIAYGYMPVA